MFRYQTQTKPRHGFSGLASLRFKKCSVCTVRNRISSIFVFDTWFCGNLQPSVAFIPDFSFAVKRRILKGTKEPWLGAARQAYCIQVWGIWTSTYYLRSANEVEIVIIRRESPFLRDWLACSLIVSPLKGQFEKEFLFSRLKLAATR